MAEWCDDCAWPEACAMQRECARREAGELRGEKPAPVVVDLPPLSVQADMRLAEVFRRDMLARIYGVRLMSSGVPQGW